jgi:hypothetical protein
MNVRGDEYPRGDGRNTTQRRSFDRGQDGYGCRMAPSVRGQQAAAEAVKRPRAPGILLGIGLGGFLDAAGVRAHSRQP